MKNTTENLIIVVYIDRYLTEDETYQITQRLKEIFDSDRIVMLNENGLYNRTGRYIDIKVLNPRLVSEEDYKEVQSLVDDISKKANELGLK